MIPTIKVNGTTYIPTDTIKHVTPLSAEDQQRIGERYNIDATKFNTQMSVATQKESMLISETVEELSKLGLALVTLRAGRLVPAEHIISASDFKREDKQNLESKGLTLNQTFRSQVETTTGTQLSTAYPKQVMERRVKALNADIVGKDAPEPVAE